METEAQAVIYRHAYMSMPTKDEHVLHTGTDKMMRLHIMNVSWSGHPDRDEGSD
jgi:hypothetical protein